MTRKKRRAAMSDQTRATMFSTQSSKVRRWRIVDQSLQAACLGTHRPR